MNRREFLKYGMGGAAAVALGTITLPSIFAPSVSLASTVPLKLSIVDCFKEMVDLTPVYHYAFAGPGLGPCIPGPTLFAKEGDLMSIQLTNTLDEPHAFTIPRVVNSGAVLPGKTRSFTFRAPTAGTYLYFDPLNAPVNRVLGLHGTMVVMPSGGSTPYSHPTSSVQELFDDLGTASHFPGEPWNPDPVANRSRCWLFNQIDPAFNAMAEANEPIDSTVFREGFLPLYFTINGQSGAFASRNPATAPSGAIGQPHLIRVLNAGLWTHSPHVHANHVYLLSQNGVVRKNVLLVDTFAVKPLDRVDCLLPFVRPPDIAGDPRIALRDLIVEEMDLVLGDVRQSPLAYPMEDNMETSQTAAGGNYPQGLTTHWEITGDADGVPFPVSEAL